MIVYKIATDDGGEYWTDDPGQVCAVVQMRSGWLTISRVEMKGGELVIRNGRVTHGHCAQ